MMTRARSVHPYHFYVVMSVSVVAVSVVAMSVVAMVSMVSVSVVVMYFSPSHFSLVIGVHFNVPKSVGNVKLGEDWVSHLLLEACWSHPKRVYPLLKQLGGRLQAHFELRDHNVFLGGLWRETIVSKWLQWHCKRV